MIDTILKERQKTHGSFKDNAYAAQEMKCTLKISPNWHKLPYIMMESLEFIVSKIARILSGNFKDPDHWRDIAGYATLVADELDKIKNK